MVPVTVRGIERVDTTKPHLYVANHLSGMDIPLLYVHLPFQFRIIAKKELFRYPFLGWHLKRSGQIPIDPSNAHAAMRSSREAGEGLRAGMPLVVCQEGGGSETGQVERCLSGDFCVAIKAQVEVVQCGIVGAFEAVPMNSLLILPGAGELIFGVII